MKETTIAFVSFFMLFFLVIIVRVGRRLKRRKISSKKMPGLLLFSKIRRSNTADLDCDCGGADCGGDCGGGDCDCGGGDCGGGDCDCGGADGCDCGDCCSSSSSSDCSGCDICFYGCGGVTYGGCGEGGCSQQETRTRTKPRTRTKITKEEQKRIIEERTIKDEQYYQKQKEQMEIVRSTRLKLLKESGYTVDEKDVAKVIELANVRGKVGLIWVSTITKLPIEVIMLIIENEPNFEVKDEYIVNRQLIPEDKPKTFYEQLDEKPIISERKIREGMCAYCNNPFETEADYCPNCGASIEIPKEPIEPIISTPEEQVDTQAHYRVSSSEVAKKPKSGLNNIPYLALVFGVISIILIFVPVYNIIIQIMFLASAFILGVCGIILKKKRALSIFGLIAGIISLIFCLLWALDVFYIWDYF
ncbi:MAG: MptD family putative ECF transporter S component [Asgard group archaeon]|nr:MptD family putative ECF transporter S component [Asgard group archaeon]